MSTPPQPRKQTRKPHKKSELSEWIEHNHPNMLGEPEWLELQALLAPIREHRARYAAEPDYVMGILRDGTMRARKRTEATLAELRAALGLFTLT